MLLSSLWNERVVAFAIGAVSLATIAFSRYRAAIRKRLDKLNILRIVRVEPADDTTLNPTMKQVELNPDFVKQCNDEQCYPKMISLGDYLATLRPANDEHLPEFVDTAVENAITRALLNGLGTKLGKAVLPVISDTPLSHVQDFISNLVGKVLTHYAARPEHRGAVPLHLSAIPGVAQLNYQVLRSKGDISVDPSGDWTSSPGSPINLLRGGEVGFEPSFSEIVTPPPSENDLLIPNPFVISKHWDRAISKMEDLLVAAGDDTKWKQTKNEDNTDDDEQEASPAFVYDADSKAMKEPVSLDEQLLPDLHLGWGSASCTHTHQEVLKNRLLSCLLNRLASNYFYTNETPFQVHVNDSSKPVTRPTELIQALVDMGHDIESCVRSNITTFGIALCVKEKDDSWTNMPLAIFLHNGLIDRDGNESFACLPHSGLNIEIRGGPLLQHCSIQHYIAIEGVCGWNSNHNADVPWMADVDSGEVMRGNKMVESVRVAAMEAICFNVVGARLQLPHGGYGLTGVCNDSAAMIQYALSGKNDVYPLTLDGQFAMQNLRCAMALRDKLRLDSSMRKEVNALNGLIKSLMTLGSDTNSLPSEAKDQIRRQLHVQQPKLPFMLMRTNVDILGSIRKDLDSAS